MPDIIKTRHSGCCASCRSVFRLLLIVWRPVPGLTYGLPVSLMHLVSQGSKRAALVAVRWCSAIEGPQGWLFMVLPLTLV